MNRYDIPSHTSERPAVIELIRSMAHKPLTAKQNQKLNNLLRSTADSTDAFIIKPAGEWLEEGNSQQHGGKLFGDFWLEGELCFLFADTNVGKSILAVQIGDAISRGELVYSLEAITGASTPTKPQTVLYFDFELTTKQFEKRYNCPRQGNYRFSPDFYRVVFNPGATGANRFDSYTEYLNNALENLLISSKARIVIIDNITCLRSGTEAAAGAVGLMRHLQQLKNKYRLSVLVLAHTPKRNPAKPITRNDLQGSKMLINFADSAFAIGESQTMPGTRYLKQIKQRSGEETYGAQNVCLARITRAAAFLYFDFTGNGNEAHHLLHFTEQARKQLEDHIITLRAQGRTLRNIAEVTNLAYSTVYRTVRRVEKEV